MKPETLAFLTKIAQGDTAREPQKSWLEENPRAAKALYYGAPVAGLAAMGGLGYALHRRGAAGAPVPTPRPPGPRPPGPRPPAPSSVVDPVSAAAESVAPEVAESLNRGGVLRSLREQAAAGRSPSEIAAQADPLAHLRVVDSYKVEPGFKRVMKPGVARGPGGHPKVVWPGQPAPHGGYIRPPDSVPVAVRPGKDVEVARFANPREPNPLVESLSGRRLKRKHFDEVAEDMAKEYGRIHPKDPKDIQRAPAALRERVGEGVEPETRDAELRAIANQLWGKMAMPDWLREVPTWI